MYNGQFTEKRSVGEAWTVDELWAVGEQWTVDEQRTVGEQWTVGEHWTVDEQCTVGEQCMEDNQWTVAEHWTLGVRDTYTHLLAFVIPDISACRFLFVNIIMFFIILYKLPCLIWIFCSICVSSVAHMTSCV